MVFRINVSITLRSSILDPQGKAAQHALNDLGFTDISKVRMGKYIQMWVHAETSAEARQLAEQACQKLLANPVMEDYDIQDVVEEAAV